ncbi:MAG TPA: hypothetical protein VFZ25_12890 [Chloroflexota bacterium]|nr:hypothetical protein [Chloroflexota bacterium]
MGSVAGVATGTVRLAVGGTAVAIGDGGWAVAAAAQAARAITTIAGLMDVRIRERKPDKEHSHD